MKPKTTPRFIKLVIAALPLFLGLTPRALPGGEVALSARVEIRRDGATIGQVAREQVLQPNSGIHGVYGPLSLDGRPVYALIKADAR